MGFLAATKFQGTAAVGSFTIPWASTASGQVALLVVAGAAVTTPTGFTALPTNANSAATPPTAAFRRVTDGSESGSLTVSMSGAAGTCAAVMVAYDETDTTTPVNGGSGTTSSPAAGGNVTIAAAATTTAAPPVQAIDYAATSQSTTSAQTFTSTTSVTRSTALSATTAPFVSLWVGDRGIYEQATTNNTPSGTVAVGTAATAVGGRVNLQRALPTSYAEGMSTATVPAWANESSTGGVAAQQVALPGGDYAGLLQHPTTGQLWPRGSK